MAANIKKIIFSSLYELNATDPYYEKFISILQKFKCDDEATLKTVLIPLGISLKDLKPLSLLDIEYIFIVPWMKSVLDQIKDLQEKNALWKELQEIAYLERLLRARHELMVSARNNSNNNLILNNYQLFLGNDKLRKGNREWCEAQKDFNLLFMQALGMPFCIDFLNSFPRYGFQWVTKQREIRERETCQWQNNLEDNIQTFKYFFDSITKWTQENGENTKILRDQIFDKLTILRNYAQLSQLRSKINIDENLQAIENALKKDKQIMTAIFSQPRIKMIDDIIPQVHLLEKLLINLRLWFRIPDQFLAKLNAECELQYQQLIDWENALKEKQSKFMQSKWLKLSYYGKKLGKITLSVTPIPFIMMVVPWTLKVMNKCRAPKTKNKKPHNKISLIQKTTILVAGIAMIPFTGSLLPLAMRGGLFQLVKLLLPGVISLYVSRWRNQPKIDLKNAHAKIKTPREASLVFYHTTLGMIFLQTRFDYDQMIQHIIPEVAGIIAGEGFATLFTPDISQQYQTLEKDFDLKEEEQMNRLLLCHAGFQVGRNLIGFGLQNLYLSRNQNWLDAQPEFGFSEVQFDPLKNLWFSAKNPVSMGKQKYYTQGNNGQCELPAFEEFSRVGLQNGSTKSPICLK